MKNKKLIKIFSIVIFLGIMFLSYSYLESRWVKINKISISSSDIPESFNHSTIVFISDIHHGPYLSIKRVSKLVNRINKLHPDMILMGGDYVHREPIYIKPAFNELKSLQSKHGIYAVLGNHDHWEDPELTRKMMMINGISICDNTSYWVSNGYDSIKIGGVGDLWEDMQILERTTNDLDSTDFSILLSHNPDYIESIESNLIDLVLSGHSHGGQVTLFGLWAPILPSTYGQKYRYGLTKYGNLTGYISSGIGTITPPLRFFCRPEIVLIELIAK